MQQFFDAVATFSNKRSMEVVGQYSGLRVLQRGPGGNRNKLRKSPLLRCRSYTFSMGSFQKAAEQQSPMHTSSLSPRHEHRIDRIEQSISIDGKNKHRSKEEKEGNSTIRGSPKSTMDIIQCASFAPIPTFANDEDCEDRPPWKRRKSPKRRASLYNLHDPSSVVKKVRLNDHHHHQKNFSSSLTRRQSIGGGAITPRSVPKRKHTSVVSAKDLTKGWPTTWEALHKATAVTARRHNKILTTTTDQLWNE